MKNSGIGIFKVHYNDNEKKDYITKVQAGKVFIEDNNKISKGTINVYIYDKAQIIDMVTDTPMKTTVFTVIKDQDGFEVGDEVEACSDGNKTYLRTVGNSTIEDNLGSLDIF